MSAWLAAFHFLRPWWLLLVLAWLPLLLWRLRVARRGAALGRLVDADLLPHLLVQTSRSRRGSWLPACLAGVLVTLAMAGPAWQRLPQPLYADGAAQVVVVSLSQRMLARDVKPDRMQRVRFKVHDLLHANAGGRNGLVAYAGAAFTVAPLTTDAHALDDLLDALSPAVMPVSGDVPAKAIERGVGLLEHAGIHGGSLVLVTDAVNAAAIAAARHAHEQGIRVSVLGVGTVKGTPVHLTDGSLLVDANGNIVMAKRDDASLRALARAGGGVYVPMRRDHADLEALTGELRASHGAKIPMSAKGDQWRDMGPWLLLPLLLLAAWSFRRGWLLMLPLALLPCIPMAAHAEEVSPATAASTMPSASPTPDARSSWPQRWSALWRNPDQRATQALAAGHPKQAEKLARSPALRGAAAYRAGDYAAAARAFARLPGADAAYNLGNALAKQGQYKQAIEAYDKALKLDPGQADARINRKAVRDWLRKHKPPKHDGRQRKPGVSPKSGQGKRQGTPQAGKHGDGKGPAQASTAPAAASSSPSPAHAASSPSPARAASAQSRAQPATASSAARTSPSSASSSGKPSAQDRTPDPRTARRQQAEARQASRALRHRMQSQANPAHHASQAFDLGRMPASAGSVDRLPEPMQRALERVPDNPGGLLWRKFQLEYQQRQHERDGGGS
ncbi:MAG TPA: tetratricopeptide repeat protein [Rhodanobacteraceae bacterium]|nr:tetratricopeptide repeat protein [Rhodanobacteraceae bacterium]